MIQENECVEKFSGSVGALVAASQKSRRHDYKTNTHSVVDAYIVKLRLVNARK